MNKSIVPDHPKTDQGTQKQQSEQKWRDGEVLDHIVTSLEKNIKESETFQEDNQIRLATAYLGMEMPNKAAEILQLVIKNNRYSTLAFLLEGVAYLWMGKDDAALATWKDGLLVGGLYAHFALMSNLVNDPNFRTHIYLQRFSIEKLFEIFECWDSIKTYTDNDVIEGFKELCSPNVSLGITHFSQILAIDPKRFDAFLGRGIGYCLTGQWQKAVEDLTRSIQLETEVDDLSLYKQSYYQHAYRFLSIAYAALGNFTYATADITKVIVRFPNDYECVLLRAKYLIKQKLFKQACNDILNVPSENLTAKDMLSLAECLYEIGSLKEALETLSKIDQRDPNALYISFLIFRDVGQYDLARKMLLAAVEALPSPMMQRHLADFLLEVGKPEQAIAIYEQFYANCPGDVSAMRAWAIALFEKVSLIEAAKAVIPFSDLTGQHGIQMYQEHEHPQLKLNGELVYSGTSLVGKNIMEKIYRDRILILDTLANLNNPLTSMSSTTFLGHRIIDYPDVDYTKIEIPQFVATKQEMQMVIDADRLGLRCIHRGPETVQYNSRITRALGFCVLIFAALIRKKDVKNRAQLLLELFQKMMTLANPMADIEANNLENQFAEMSYAPVYYLVRGHRESPRFENAIPAAVRRVIKQLTDSSSERVFLPYVDVNSIKTYQDIYAATQHNLKVSNTWKIKECPELFSDEETELPTPTIVLQSIGALGFNFSVRAPCDMASWGKANCLIASLVDKIASDDEDTLPSLAALVDIIWTRQPFTCYSPELGHVFIHAYAIAKKKVELSEYHFSFAEDFILQMIEPDQERLERLLESHITNNYIMPIYNEESIDYWTSPQPTVFKIMSLLNLSNELFSK